MHIWGCPTEIRIYNPYEKKLDYKTISGYFIGYAERSKGYHFYCPSRSMLIVEARNAKFLEDRNISGSQQPQKIIFEEEREPVVADQTVNPQPVNQDGLMEGQLADNEPPTNDLIPIKTDVQTTTLRSERARKSSIDTSIYESFLLESDFNIGIKEDPVTFSQAMSELIPHFDTMP